MPFSLAQLEEPKKLETLPKHLVAIEQPSQPDLNPLFHPTKAHHTNPRTSDLTIPTWAEPAMEPALP